MDFGDFVHNANLYHLVGWFEETKHSGKYRTAFYGSFLLNHGTISEGSTMDKYGVSRIRDGYLSNGSESLQFVKEYERCGPAFQYRFWKNKHTGLYEGAYFRERNGENGLIMANSAACTIVPANNDMIKLLDSIHVSI